MQLQHNLNRRTTDIQMYDGNHRQNLRDKLMKEKTLELKKTIELIKENTYEKKNKKNTIPQASISTREKHARTDTKNGKIGRTTKN